MRLYAPFAPKAQAHERRRRITFAPRLRLPTLVILQAQILEIIGFSKLQLHSQTA